MSATIRDLSTRCGLPISVISKALNNLPGVDEETRRRVIDAADEIGYFPATVFRKKDTQSYSLGVILDDENQEGLLHNYFSVVLNGFKRQAEKLGYELTLINRKVGRDTDTYAQHYARRNFDGVCLLCLYFYDREVLELVRSGVPIVAIDHHYTGKDCVISDNSSGMSDILKYVISMGHRRIAFIHGTPSAVTEERVQAFERIMRENGISVPPEYIVSGHYHSTRHEMEATNKLLKLPERPTCILMTDDYSALGGIEAIGKAGLRIPEDISIVGYDGLSMIQKLRPKLATYMQNAELIGQRAAARLIERIENPDKPMDPPDIISGVLIKGETVKRLASGE